ncbi:hypothetical protein CCACVL1_24169 [Corchorus capsularis]|uniref:DNA 3'-5' helicase n=1 Tax=Corchorus capsularis TaxID=210143 RepID=A0A1R3GQP7_COCAP|nr:hypothetical protein CCACVL1_24169 [Corchorus capsularis]
MPPSPALRYSPGRELRGDKHKRGRSLEGGLGVRDKEDDLALFNEMQTREREDFLLQSSDDFEDSFSTKLKHFSEFKLGISIPARGESSELLNADEEKNDYEWLLTPPDTPLFPSLDDEPLVANVAHRGRPRSQAISISRSSTMDKSYRSSRGSASPNRLSPSPRSGNSALQSRGRPSSAPQSSPVRPATPTRRPSPPQSKISTPARRSSTPTPRRTSTGSSGTVASSGVRGTSPVRTSRGNSASPKIRAWQSNIPGFSLEAPPNLRTSLADRPASYVRGSSPASRNGRDAKFGRQSMSPTPSRSASSSRSHDRDQFSSYSRGSIASSGDDDLDSLQSIPISGSSHSVSRRLGPLPNNKAPTFNKKSARVMSPSSAPKRSFDSALRQMDHRKSPPNMFRPLLSSVPSTTFYTGKGSSAHRSLISRNSSVTSSSNASSDQVSAVLDSEVNDQQHDDMASESGKGPYADVQEEVFAFDKMDVLNQDASYERRDGSLNILMEDADRDSAIQCDPEQSEELSRHGLEVEISSTSDALCDRGDLSEVDSFDNTKICSRCGCRYHVIEPVEEEISLCTDCSRQQDIAAFDLSERTIVTEEISPGLSIKICEEDKQVKELEASLPSSDSLLQVTDAVEPLISQQEENIKQSENFSQENSLGRSLAEGGEQRLDNHQEIDQPAVGYSLPDRDTGSQHLQNSGEHSGLKIHTSEVAGISVLLKRSSSNKGAVVQGRTFATIPYEDLSYARDSSNSFRSSIGHGSISASSSVDFSSSRQTDTRVQRQFSGRKSDLENYRYDMNSKPQSLALSLSRSSSNNYQALSLAASTNEDNFEGSVRSLKFDEVDEIAVVSQAKVVASENFEADLTDSSFTGAAIPEKDGIEWNEISRTMDSLTSELLEATSAAPFPPSEDCVYENGDDLPSNARIVSNVEASASTLDPTIEEHSLLNDTLEGVDVAEPPGLSSLATISEIEMDNSCQSSSDSETDGLSPNHERKKGSVDLTIANPPDMNTTASIQEHNTSNHADGILEESTVLVESHGGSKARSLTLEEATDTILFCSSIVHDLAYQAATIAIEKENSVPLEGSRPTVTILGKSTADRKDLRGRTVGRRNSKSNKVRQRRVETDAKSPSPKTENDENADESSYRNVGIPNKVEIFSEKAVGAMDSDSDSDGSHISATPPRDPLPPPSRPTPPPPPPKPPTSFHKSTTKIKPSSDSNTISKPKKPSKKHSKSKTETKLEPKPDSKPVQQAEPPPFPSPIGNFPFQIRRPSEQSQPISTVHSLETLPAGFFSTHRTSFSKFQKQSLTFEPEITPEIATERKANDSGCSGSTNTSNKKLPNLIRGDVPLPPANLQKRSVEGNFVKLNFSYKRKFATKGKKTNSYSSKSRYYRKSKRRVKSEVETESICDEEGLVVEIKHQPNVEKKIKFEHIEEAVLAVRKEASDENLVSLLKVMYGYDTFRDGQMEAIKMVLAGKSTMLVLPTGAGKSLCYQIPAVVLPGITLVVSPLVALMIDQLKQLPPMIRGSFLSSSQGPEEAAETLRLIQEGSIKVLFISPERFLNAEFLSIFSASTSVSLVVVDEAHCVSEWSHNFRPSYMRLRASLLRANLNVDCILAMTATATKATLHSVMSALEIPSTNLIQKAQIRDNLRLSVSLSGNRLKNLLKLLKSSPFSEAQSIIVYCKFQSETDLISRYLYDNNINAKSYHSGMPAKDRSRVQELFCANKIKVVVATVAFGMGLDKRDVGAVIHYSLPESLEEYVQEIGRGGRDGRLSYCHLFFDDVTYYKLRSLMHSDGVDEYAVNKFLCEVFADDTNSRGKVCSLVKESASRKFDMKEEVMLTLLTQLELGETQFLHLLPQLNVTCTVHFHKTSPMSLADKDTAVTAILKKSEIKQGQYVFDIPTVANSIGVGPSDLLNHLQNLKVKGEITYELKDPAYCYKILEVPSDFCSLSELLTRWLMDIENCKVWKLDAMYSAAAFAADACDKADGCNFAQQTSCLQKRILDYFKGDDNPDVLDKMSDNSPFLRADIKVFLQSNSQIKFTPRAVARIMHGIRSPAYPSSMWSKTHFW